MSKKVSNKQRNQPYDTRVSFDDKVHIARNKTSVPPLSQGAVDGAVKYKPITEELSAFEAQKMIDNAINVVERHLEHYKNSPNKEILNPEELLRATQDLVDKRTFDKFHDDDLYTFHMYAEAGRNLLNNEVNENKVKQKEIYVNESTLKNIIRKTIKEHLKEHKKGHWGGADYEIELERETYHGDIPYTIIATVELHDDGSSNVTNMDIVDEESFTPEEMNHIEDDLIKRYDENMEEAVTKALEVQDNNRD